MKILNCFLFEKIPSKQKRKTQLSMKQLKPRPTFVEQ